MNNFINEEKSKFFTTNNLIEININKVNCWSHTFYRNTLLFSKNIIYEIIYY